MRIFFNPAFVEFYQAQRLYPKVHFAYDRHTQIIQRKRPRVH